MGNKDTECRIKATTVQFTDKGYNRHKLFTTS